MFKLLKSQRIQERKPLIYSSSSSPAGQKIIWEHYAIALWLRLEVGVGYRLSVIIYCNHVQKKKILNSIAASETAGISELNKV